jgi:RNA polymerase sigma factor (sigma-70 family)
MAVVRGGRRRRASGRIVEDSSERDQRFARLMRCGQTGDRHAYAQLLHEIIPLLRRAVRRQRSFLKPQDVEDLVQEILLSLHEVRATYDPGRPFLPWLMAIARHRVADAARRYVSRSAHEVVVEQLPETFSTDDPNRTGEVYGDPEALRLAMKELPRGQRHAIEMLKLREMSLKEAAAFSGMSVAALKVAVHRGMNTLRRVLRAKV